MKKVLLLKLGMLCSFWLTAQIEKTEIPEYKVYGEVNKLGAYVALKYLPAEQDTTFLLLFKNLQYQHITDIQSVEFSGEYGTADTLYAMLSSALETEKDTRTTFKLGKEDIIVTKIKVMGFNGINLRLLRNGATFGLNRKDLDRLFAKSAN